MRKLFIVVFIFIFQILSVQAETLTGEVSFDWISKSQMERDENISTVKNLLFDSQIVKNYGRRYMKTVYKNYLRDKDYVLNYSEVSQGKTEDVSRNYCAFYWKKYLIAYGIQYKKNPGKNYYYDAMGHLKWVDIFSEEYPHFPYKTYQYEMNGKLKAVYYYTASYDQYIFDEKGNFQGRWYKDKMYDRKANVIMTRSNWD